MGGKKKRKVKPHVHSGQQKGGRRAPGEKSETVVASKGKSGHGVPVPGLSNLGNTCFFNSVMQNLGRSHYFKAELDRLLATPNYNMEIQLRGVESSSRQLSLSGSVGQLTERLSSFLTEAQTGGRVLNPRSVFSEICKKAPRFSGYHQQDSQELLRYLLDSLRSEEINRIKRAVLTSYNVTSGKKDQKDLLTESDRADIKAYGLQAHQCRTFVDNVFGGVLVSTVVCKECGNNSTIHETFLDLSLPITEDHKSMASPPSPVGYQTRSKNKKKGEPGVIPIAKPQPELSKHQRKRKEKQAKKAARSANKKSLQKFLSENKATDPTSSTDKDIDEDPTSPTDKDLDEDPTSPTDKDLDEDPTSPTDKDLDEDPTSPTDKDLDEDPTSPTDKDLDEDPTSPTDKDLDEDPTSPIDKDLDEDPTSPTDKDLDEDPTSPIDKGINEEEDCKSNSLQDGNEIPDALQSEDHEPNVKDTDPSPYVTSDSKLDPPVNPATGEPQVLPSPPVHVDPSDIKLGVSTQGEVPSPSNNDGGQVNSDMELPSSRDHHEDQPDAEMTSGTLGEGYAATGPQTDVSSVRQGVASLEINDREGNASEGPVELQEGNDVPDQLPGEDGDSLRPKPAQGGAAEVIMGSKEDIDTRKFQSLKFEQDSLQFSLKKFCTPELLTGTNKFACSVCTKLKFEEQSKDSDSTKPDNELGLPEAMEDVQQENNEQCQQENSENTEQCQQENNENTEQCQQENTENIKQCQDANVDQDDSNSNVCPDIREGDECQQDKDKRRGSEGDQEGVDSTDSEGEESIGEQELTSQNDDDDADNEESSEEEEDTPKPKEKESGIVFSEATKQMLIEKPPLVLTLHLKRFLQNGRRLRKNNRHVSFPSLLDISPFCVDDCQRESDSAGQLLYSLYGIVEHSGSMQGGHYTAYIRVRTPPKTSKETSHNKDSSTTNKESALTESEPTEDHLKVLEVLDTSHDEIGAAVDSCTLNFDLSSTKGQWYYVSDSHVRTATESEVTNSQAYLLFYERLPLL